MSPAPRSTEAHWDAFWAFYQDTGSRKWGQPYLTRAFFSLLGERMADRVLLIFALRDGRPIAGALNLIGEDALYGRYWGAIEEVPHLHFEICYYQAIEAAIERGLARVEAGAQGPHKLSRGYAPVPTWSAHFIPDPRLPRRRRRFPRRRASGGGSGDRSACRDDPVPQGMSPAELNERGHDDPQSLCRPSAARRAGRRRRRTVANSSRRATCSRSKRRAIRRSAPTARRSPMSAARATS